MAEHCKLMLLGKILRFDHVMETIRSQGDRSLFLKITMTGGQILLMRTAKSEHARVKRRHVNKARAQTQTPENNSPSVGFSSRGVGWIWRLAAVIIVVLAALLRFSHLAVSPLHHDEGVNGGFLITLFARGMYHYDPQNYHGPSLYYFALLVAEIRRLFGSPGLSTVGIRFVPAVFGTATVYLSLVTRRYLGRWGALGAAALLAFSPGAVYFSRYFIHETPFVFFTLCMVIAGGRYRETRRLIFLVLLAVSAAFLFATKETAIITLAVLAMSWVLTVLYMRLRLAPLQMEFLGWENGTIPWLPLSIALTAFVSVHVLFYSSFGSNFPRGVYDSLVTYRYWFATAAGNAPHARFAYLQWLVREEPVLTVLGAAGLALAFYRGRNTFALFCGFWSTGMLVVYSLIPYKTPWLLLNVVLPLALMGGYAIGEASSAISFLRQPLRSVLTVLLALMLLLPAYHAIDISYFRYDDDSVAYVYVHTQRGFLSMVEKIREIATHVGTGTNTSIVVASPDYWPLPWYLRDYTHVGYWGHVIPTTDQIVIGRDFQAAQLQSVLGENYELAGRYNLRPGVGLVLFSRRERRP